MKFETQTSANNTSAVTLSPGGAYPNHFLQVTTTGAVAAGTATVGVNGQTIPGTIDLTAPAPVTIIGAPADTIVVTPASFSAGCTFTAKLKSWD